VRSRASGSVQVSFAGSRQCFTQAGTDSMIVIRRRLGFMTGPGASGFKFRVRPGWAESHRLAALASLSLSQVLQFVPCHGQFVLNVTRRPTLAAGAADTDPRRGRRPGVRRGWPELEPGSALRLAGPPPGLLCCRRSAAAGDRDLGTEKRCLTRPVAAIPTPESSTGRAAPRPPPLRSAAGGRDSAGVGPLGGQKERTFLIPNLHPHR
jgi:hypothetical protein